MQLDILYQHSQHYKPKQQVSDYNHWCKNSVKKNWDKGLEQSVWCKFVDSDNFIATTIHMQPLSLALMQRLTDEDTVQPHVIKHGKAMLPGEYGIS